MDQNLISDLIRISACGVVYVAAQVIIIRLWK